MSYLRIIGKFSNISFINVHVRTEDENDDIKDQFCDKLDSVYDRCPRHDNKIIIGDSYKKLDIFWRYVSRVNYN